MTVRETPGPGDVVMAPPAAVPVAVTPVVVVVTVVLVVLSVREVVVDADGASVVVVVDPSPSAMPTSAAAKPIMRRPMMTSNLGAHSLLFAIVGR
jgi:hypothetical protein